MIIKDNIMYAGITTEKGIEFFNSVPNIRTGYVFKRITDGNIVGNKIELKHQRESGMYVEIKDERVTLENNENNYFQDGDMIYAGITTTEGVQLFKGVEEPYTGKRFVRIHDGLLFGNQIQLGKDFSYTRTIEGARIDTADFYAVVDDVEEGEDI